MCGSIDYTPSPRDYRPENKNGEAKEHAHTPLEQLVAYADICLVPFSTFRRASRAKKDLETAQDPLPPYLQSLILARYRSMRVLLEGFKIAGYYEIVNHFFL